jgi:hypothetical protein
MCPDDANKVPEKKVGAGCWDVGAASYPNSWNVSDGNATFDGAGGGYNSTFTWSVPSQIPADGEAPVTLGAMTHSDNGAGSDAQICATGSFSLKEGANTCAHAYAPGANTSGSDSKTLTLLGDSASSGTTDVEVDLGGGGPVYYYYQLVTPSPPPSGGGCSGAADRPAADPPRAHAAAPNEVHVVKICPDVQFHKGGTPPDAWLPVELDTVLKAGDEITCDPDGAVTLAFADNSTVTIRNTTQLKISSFFVEGGVVRTEILLKMGEISAQVNKSEATKSDFRIAKPSFGGVRGAPDAGATAASSTGSDTVDAGSGASFSVFYAPGSNTELVSASSGPVAITPANPSLHPVLVPAGDEVEVTPTYESPPAPIGQAGARGGDDILTAQNIADAAIAKDRKACGADTAHSYTFAITPAANGWTVSVTLHGKRARGTALFKVTGKTVTPANALARKVAGGCKASRRKH